MQLSAGTLLKGGKYKIEKVLGQGGFGITYLASQKISIEGPIGQIKTEIKLAIKEFFMKDVCNRNEDSNIVSVPSVGSKELVERFKQKFVKEAWNISKLNHSHIVKVVDVFEENSTAYYVMEYHNGGSLSDLVKDGNPLPEADAVRYITQIADAVGYIHKQKVNHLDIKPGNILLDGKANGILIDFGLSKQYDEKGSQTSSTPVGISHGYAPMEQYNLGGVSTFTPQSDIYSLGATLYKLVTGATPPQANEIFNDGLPALPAYLSDGVKKAIEQAMQPRKKERPATAEEFISLLSSDAPVVAPAVEPATDEVTKIITQPSEEALVEKPIEEPTPEPAATEKKDIETQKEEPAKENEVKEESNVWKWVLAAIIVGIFVWFVGGNTSSDEPLVVKHPAKITQSQPVKEPVKESVKDSVTEPVKVTKTEPVKEPVKVAKTEPAKEPVKKQVKKKEYDYMSYFSEGLVKVKLNGKWGFIDEGGNEVTPLKYDYAADFSEGLAAVELNGKWGYIDESGSVVIPLKYDDTMRFSEGIACVKLNGKWGFIDKSGDEVISFKYDGAGVFDEGLARVLLNGEWISIDKQGNRVK